MEIQSQVGILERDLREFQEALPLTAPFLGHPKAKRMAMQWTPDLVGVVCVVPPEAVASSAVARRRARQ